MNILADEIINTLPALLFHIDNSGQVIDFKASPYIQSHPQPPQLPCTLLDLWPPATATEIAHAIAHLEQGQPPRLLNYTINGADQRHHFRARITKQADHFTLIALDASAELDQEQARHRLYEQVRQNQKMEALGQLTSGISHDFNNLLASILGYADLALDGVESGEQKNLRRYLREVIDSAEKARDLIAQMRAFARAKPDTTIPLPLPINSGQSTILVIDDEESCARLQGELLRNKGFIAVIFSDPLLALEAFKVNPQRFNLVLVDQAMPGMTGIEVAQVLLQLRPELPIILNTSEETHDYSAAAYSTGIRALLSKPIHAERLLQTIIELLPPPQ